MQDAEDDGAGDAKDEHQQALAEEPFADLQLGLLEGVVETVALLVGKEREEEAISVFAFKHEVDAKKDCGENVEEVREPRRQRGKEIAGGFGKSAFGALDDGIDIQLGGEGKLVDAGNGFGNALG